MLQFSYWPQIQLREPSHIYEMRSYRLKPGTMIEWGNNWARGINYRQNNNVPFAGFFSQIGRLYNVHHIWCKWFKCVSHLKFQLIGNLIICECTLDSLGYKSLQDRKESRESAWRAPGKFKNLVSKEITNSRNSFISLFLVFRYLCRMGRVRGLYGAVDSWNAYTHLETNLIFTNSIMMALEISWQLFDSVSVFSLYKCHFECMHFISDEHTIKFNSLMK